MDFITDSKMKNNRMFQLLGEVTSTNFVLDGFTISKSNIGSSSYTSGAFLDLSGTFKNIEVKNFKILQQAQCTYSSLVKIESPTSINLNTWAVTNSTLDTRF